MFSEMGKCGGVCVCVCVNSIHVSIYLVWNLQRDSKYVLLFFSSFHVYRWFTIFYFGGSEKSTLVVYEILDLIFKLNETFLLSNQEARQKFRTQRGNGLTS